MTAPITNGVWSALPSGDDIAIRAGNVYAVIASVSKSYDKQTILSHVPAGVTLIDYAEQGDRADIPVDPNTDHRTVVATFSASQDAGTLPWKSPWPTTIYSLSQAWWVVPGQGPAPPPPVAPSSAPVWPWALGGGAVLAGAVYLWWRAHRKRR